MNQEHALAEAEVRFLAPQSVEECLPARLAIGVVKGRQLDNVREEAVNVNELRKSFLYPSHGTRKQLCKNSRHAAYKGAFNARSIENGVIPTDAARAAAVASLRRGASAADKSRRLPQLATANGRACPLADAV
jgi:hypothetical protein